MITVKISKSGGYILGDGPCKFDPDRFMRHVMPLMIEHNLTEQHFTDEQINQMLCKQMDEFNAAEKTELPDTADLRQITDTIMAVIGVPEDEL